MVCAEPDTLCSSMSLCACVGESSLMGGRAHRTARTGPAHRDRGGDRLRERLDHARAAHGVRGTLQAWERDRMVISKKMSVGLYRSILVGLIFE